jgi:hypothetical protein
MDESGVIVGSSTADLPTIPPRGTFDYFGYIGGARAMDTPATGKPAKVTVAKGDVSPQACSPVLKTGKPVLANGNAADTFSDTAFGYNLSVVVTNSTDQKIGNDVTQQVILSDTRGQVVGGGSGASDNAPTVLAPGERYREVWTGIPAISRAASATYNVWPGS